MRNDEREYPASAFESVYDPPSKVISSGHLRSHLDSEVPGMLAASQRSGELPVPPPPFGVPVSPAWRRAAHTEARLEAIRSGDRDPSYLLERYRDDLPEPASPARSALAGGVGLVAGAVLGALLTHALAARAKPRPAAASGRPRIPGT